ncbi:hypothetical protein Ga0466249_004678 [Sporomusaceae bacterium BoRhaA]|nr:hypothetical protein [Pelorhabdus rhamnosifermentans]
MLKQNVSAQRLLFCCYAQVGMTEEHMRNLMMQKIHL